MQATTILKDIQQQLSGIYEDREARTIARYLLEDFYHVDFNQQLEGQYIKAFDKQQYMKLLNRLLAQEPLQYVLGEADFYGLKLCVSQDVLIPRPETEELVHLIIKNHQKSKQTFRVLDIGTGSACIPIALAKHLPQADIWALDISKKALKIAQHNAQQYAVSINFVLIDFLNEHEKLAALPSFDIVVSNPPYIPYQEQASIKQNVINYEPSMALFVPDNEPLIFYKNMALYVMNHAASACMLYAEIHHKFGNQVQQLWQKVGFSDVKILKDLHGKDRFAQASKKL